MYKLTYLQYGREAYIFAATLALLIAARDAMSDLTQWTVTLKGRTILSYEGGRYD